ncbi:MAG: discoidin domain-containing protein [Tannerella sp.]|jgi:hypothetical protein|nr:discoidin domain-containing protein [Tannerella sp.]
MAASAVLTSCYDAEPVPEVNLPQFLSLAISDSHNATNIKDLSLIMGTSADTTIAISMSYGGTTDYKRGIIAAEAGVDAALVDTYNAANGTGYKLLPEEFYRFDKTTLTIADGFNRSDFIRLTVSPKNIDFTAEYLLPVSIKSVSQGNIPINEEFKTQYLVFRGEIETTPGREKWTVAGASSEWQNIYFAKQAFDNDPATFWHTELNGMPQWFAVDMVGNKRIDGFMITNRKDINQNALPKHITIEVGMDGVNWETVLDIPELPTSRVMQVVPLPQAATARFFKFNVLSTHTGDPYTYLAEINIYSGTAPEPEVDMEIHTWTIDSYSSQWNTGSACSNLIDGNKETLWHSEPFDDALNKMPQWVLFDMQKSRKIKGIKIWHRQNDHGMEPKHIVFEVSDDKQSWTALIDEPELSNEWQTQQDLKAPTPQSGRYLRMTVLTNQSNLNWTALGEVTPY